jgi:chloramphenicol O-acetyltransferase type A
MKIIDLEHWDRREQYAFFRRMDYPQFNICAPIDVTRLYDFVKDSGLPFYYVMIYAATTAANDIVNFRYRIRDGVVIEHDRVHPSFTHMDKGCDLFKYVTADMGGDMPEFIRAAQDKAQRQKGFLGDGNEESRDDVLYLTCVPWVAFTNISHTISLNKDDSVPRISWGKYYKEGGRTLLPFSVQVNHALADGVHIGKYLDALGAYIESL